MVRSTTEGVRLARSITVVFLVAGIRWVLCCVRIVLVAFLFGATFAYDAYLVAFSIPEMVAGLLVGVIAVTFIPLFCEYLSKESEAKAWDFVSNLINIVFVVSLSLTIIMIVIAPVVVRIVAPGFHYKTFQLAVHLVIIMFPIVLIISLAELITRIFHTYQRFALPTLAGVLEVIVVILCLLFLTEKYGIFSLAFGLLFGAIVRLVVLLPLLGEKIKYYRLGLNFRLPGIKKVNFLAGPLISSMLFLRLGVVIERLLASTLKEGTISILGYATTLTQVPSEIFIGSIGIVLFPLISKYASEGNMSDFKTVVSKGIRMGNFILFPIAMLFIFFGKQIIGSLLERGKFVSLITHDTSIALAVYALSMFVTAVYFFSVHACYALQEVRATIKIAVFVMIFNIMLKLIFITYLSFAGLALATSLALIVHSGILARFVRKKIGPLNEKIIVSSSLKTLLASFLMAAICWLSLKFILPSSHKLIQLSILMLSAGISYFIFSYLLRSQELILVKDLFKKMLVPTDT